MKLMHQNIPWRSLVLCGTLLVAGTGPRAHAQQTNEVEQLKSTVQTLEQTVQDLTREVQALKNPPTNAPVAAPSGTQAMPGVPPALTTPAGTEVQPPGDELADATTPIQRQDTMNEEELGAPRPGNAPLDPSYQGFMPILGTKTWIRLGGYAKIDAIMDSTKVGNPNSFLTSRIPVEGETDYGKDEHFALHAKQTRLNFELRSPTDLGALKIFYENDFFNNSDQPSMDYRLRHFYGQVANLTIGQTWSTFHNPDAGPDTLDFEGPGALPSLRQPEVRYTIPIKKNEMYTSLAIEQPKSDLSNLPDGADGRNRMPDFAGNWRWERKSGHIQASGLLRSLSYDNSTGPDDTELGWGLNLSGALKVFENDTVMGGFCYGDGIGRYIQDLPSGSGGVVDAAGNLETLTAYGGWIGYRHQWNERFRSTASYSYVQMDSHPDQGEFAYDNTHYAQCNLIWAPTKNFYVGAEYLYGMKETRNGNTGDDHRVQLSFQYKLIR